MADKLDEDTQKQYRKTLVGDASERVDEVLTWLPANTESFFFLQTPVRIARPPVYRQPELLYALDRFSKVGAGRFFKALHGTTIRFVASVMTNIGPRTSFTPAVFPEGDAVS